MAAYSGTGPAQATVSVYVRGTTRLASIFSDVGMTVATVNPFAMAGVAYSFYAAAGVYVVFGKPVTFYEATEETEVHTAREYLGPRGVQKPTYLPTNVTQLRTGDFSTLVAADVRSILGTLIQDLRDQGILK